MGKICAVCAREIFTEEPPLLTIGGSGIPRHLCEECASDLDEAMQSSDYETIISAMNRITDKARSSGATEDRPTFAAIKEIFTEANERAEKIKDGTYDFSLDSETEGEECSFTITDEYKETEEDRELDRRDAERAKVFDRFYGWFAALVLVAALGFLVYKFFF